MKTEKRERDDQTPEDVKRAKKVVSTVDMDTSALPVADNELASVTIAPNVWAEDQPGAH